MIDTLYISQRAANAIIADVAPYRISSEALLVINSFLDEFLYFLVDSAKSLDLIRIKLAISQVLPTSLGKNAVLEAELELKTYVESGNSDHTKEKTIEITPFPLQKVYEQFRVKCQFFSTLGERGVDDRDHDIVPDLYASEGVHIAPSLAIYLTAVLEYVGEFILILVAKASEKQGVEVARAQEVYSALSEDSRISPLFRKTGLKKQMESQYEITAISSDRATKSSINITTSQLSTRTSSESSIKSPKAGYMQSSPLHSPRSPIKSSSHNGGIGGRQVSLEGFGNDWRKGPTSPVKSPSDYGRQHSEHKNVGMRSTKSMQSLQGQGGDRESDLRSVSSMEDSIEKMKSFENLISSNQTMKVSLTPNRLITIETHKRPPKLAPREPVTRERIIQKSSPTSPSNEEFDDDDDELLFGKRKPRKDIKEESLWEFLKNTSPDDVLGDKVKKKDSKIDLSNRRRKTIDKLESVPERSNPPYIPLIPSAKSSPTSLYQSDRINATINQTLSSSRASDSQNQSRLTSPTSSSHLPSLRNSKSLDQTQSSYYQNSRASKSTGYIQSSAKSVSSSKLKPRPDPLDLIDDDDLLYPEGQKKPKRRHQAQDLIDFLSTSPDSILNNGVGQASLDTSNVGKKKEKKLKKLFSMLKKSSLTDESTSSPNAQRPANVSISRFSTTNIHGSNSTGNKPARYVKIEIPKIPPKEDNQEQSIFDQVEIQGRHARQVSRASLSGSARNTPNRSTFSITGGMKSPKSPTTILEKSDDDCSEYTGTTADWSKKSLKSTNISNIQQPPTNTTTLSQSNNNNVPTYPPHKILSPVPLRQKSYDNVVNKNNNNQTSSQTINKDIPALPKEQKLEVSETLSSPNLAAKSSTENEQKSQYISSTKTSQSFTSPEESPSITTTNDKNSIDENEKVEEVQIKSDKVVVSEECVQKGIISYDSFLASIIEAEISTQDTQDIQEEITIVTYNEEEESREAFVVEWLLGTGLTFKNAMSYVDIMQVYEEEVPEMEKSEYEDADDTEFIYDRDEHIVAGNGEGAVAGNIVQVGA